MSDTSLIEQSILSLITEVEGSVSFVGLTSVDGFPGDNMFGILDKNIVFWEGLSESACDALNNLMKEKKIHIKPVDVLIYMIDGALLNLPIVKQTRAYKKLHWLPVVFGLGPRRR